ncbi:MAG: EcsC family protein [Polyangiaceae bacterium]|nr:EcsC family protein [Polyangiaceae bacterium]
MTDGQSGSPPPHPDSRATEARPFRSAAEWAAHLRWRALTTPKPSVSNHVHDLLGAPIDRLEDLVFRSERSTVADRFVANGLRVLNDLVQRPRGTDRVIDRYRERDATVRSLADIRALPLETIDAARPAWLTAYDLAAAVGGGVGGFFGALGSVITVPTLFYASLHAIGSYALHFGHDLRDLDEQDFAVALLATSLVARPTTRVEVLARLEASADSLEAGSPDEADEHRVAILEHVAEAVVLRVLLGLAVRGWPGVGLVLGAGFSRAFVGQVCETAFAAYGERWLLRRYGDSARVLTAR